MRAIPLSTILPPPPEEWIPGPLTADWTSDSVELDAASPETWTAPCAAPTWSDELEPDYS